MSFSRNSNDEVSAGAPLIQVAGLGVPFIQVASAEAAYQAALLRTVHAPLTTWRSTSSLESRLLLTP